MAIKESALSALSSIAQSDFIRVVTSAGASRKITLTNLASIINSKLHIDIASNTDLDTLLTEGFYGCPSNSVAQSLSHCPSTYSFVMIVISKNTSGTLPIQILTNGTYIYVRTKATAGWANWYRFSGTELT